MKGPSGESPNENKNASNSRAVHVTGRIVAAGTCRTSGVSSEIFAIVRRRNKYASPIKTAFKIIYSTIYPPRELVNPKSVKYDARLCSVHYYT